MPVFDHLILNCRPHRANDVAARIAATPHTGRVFGIFAPQIGLSINHLVVLTECPDGTAATIPVSDPEATAERHELWDTAPRPASGETLTDEGGYYSHRWFDCREADWPRFQELSVTAWDNFEDVHDTRVIGFWRARTAPAHGLVRVWLMAWYRDLAAWEGSRWYQAAPSPEAKAAFERFRERRALTVDSAVTILKRVG